MRVRYLREYATNSVDAPGTMTLPLPDESSHSYQSHSNDARSCSIRERRLSRWGPRPRFHNSRSDAVPNNANTISDTASTSLASNDYADWDGKILTIIDIQERNFSDKIITKGNFNKPPDFNDFHGGDDSGCFSSKLRKLLLPCFPQNEVAGDSDSKFDEQRDNDHTDDDRMMQIECILEQALDNKNSDDLPTPTLQTVVTQNPLSISTLPPLSEWNQYPLFLAATPGSSGMCIRRIRRTSERSYFETPKDYHSDACCAINKTIQLPINNGKEHPSNVRVIDFETKLFAGTALFRIRGCSGWKMEGNRVCDSTTTHDYFAKQNRKFQMVIRGKFKSAVIMADCMSGLLLDHQLITSSSMNCVHGLSCSVESESHDKRNEVQKLKRGKSSRKDGLPSKLALRTAVKVAGIFSPRMDADLECASPRILSPLCSTAQTINVSRNIREGCISSRLEDSHAEPCFHSTASLVNDLCQSTTKPQTTSMNSVQYRKSAFDAIYDAHISSTADASPCFDQDAEYTFEFLQHLIDYNDLSLDCGKVIGKIKLGGALRGQPVRLVSVVKRGIKNSLPGDSINMDKFDCLWSFDLWQKSLLPNR